MNEDLDELTRLVAALWAIDADVATVAEVTAFRGEGGAVTWRAKFAASPAQSSRCRT